MRTTVTIDPDTEALIKEEIRRTGLSFKAILNRSLRNSLTRRGEKKVALRPLFPAAFPPHLSDVNMNHLADALDDEETLREMRS